MRYTIISFYHIHKVNVLHKFNNLHEVFYKG